MSLARAAQRQNSGCAAPTVSVRCARDVVDQGGWVVRADATGLVALFKEGPKTDRTHSTRAIEQPSAWSWRRAGPKNGPKRQSQCQGSRPVRGLRGSHRRGHHRPSLGGGHLALTIAGQTADLAHRLDGRAKGLGWSLPSRSRRFPSGSAFTSAARQPHRYRPQRHYSIAEVSGFNPGTAKPGELPLMADVREAVLANTMLANLAGDVDQLTADRTIMVRPSALPRAKPARPFRSVASNTRSGSGDT